MVLFFIMQISHFKYEDFKSNLEYDFDEAIMTKHNILKYQMNVFHQIMYSMWSHCSNIF